MNSAQAFQELLLDLAGDCLTEYGPLPTEGCLPVVLVLVMLP